MDVNPTQIVLDSATLNQEMIRLAIRMAPHVCPRDGERYVMAVEGRDFEERGLLCLVVSYEQIFRRLSWFPWWPKVGLVPAISISIDSVLGEDGSEHIGLCIGSCETWQRLAVNCHVEGYLPSGLRCLDVFSGLDDITLPKGVVHGFYLSK